MKQAITGFANPFELTHCLTQSEISFIVDRRYVLAFLRSVCRSTGLLYHMFRCWHVVLGGLPFDVPQTEEVQ